MTKVTDLTEPGLVQVILRYEMPSDYPAQPGDSLVVVTRDFRLYSDTTYAEIFQHPDQFMFSLDSLVSVNLLDISGAGAPVQIAYSPVAPLEYDRLIFEMSPPEWVKINDKTYPLRRTGMGAGTVVEVVEPITVLEGQTTVVHLTIAVHKALYRLGDEFIFLAHADSYSVEGPQ